MVQTAPMSMPNDNTTTEPNRIPTAHPEQRADPARPLRVAVSSSVLIWSMNAPVPPAHEPFMRCSGVGLR